MGAGDENYNVIKLCLERGGLDDRFRVSYGSLNYRGSWRPRNPLKSKMIESKLGLAELGEIRAGPNTSILFTASRIA